MDCWHCGTELIWGADHDMEDVNEEDLNMISSQHLLVKCEAYVEVYHQIVKIRMDFLKEIVKEIGDDFTKVAKI